jgi:predicted NAD-dependent protein-ADP-ribosyltransferase YbiA (DUF1768 family)
MPPYAYAARDFSGCPTAIGGPSIRSQRVRRAVADVGARLFQVPKCKDPAYRLKIRSAKSRGQAARIGRD